MLYLTGIYEQIKILFSTHKEEVTFLAMKNINTMEELEFNPEETNTQKHLLENKRKYVYGKIKRCRNADSKALLQQDVETMTAQIKKLRKEVLLYERIKKRSFKVLRDFQRSGD